MMMVFSVDPVLWLRVTIFLMRFVQHILTRVALLFAVGVIVVSPIASATANHSCCPDIYENGSGTASHDLMAHYGQAVQMSHSMINQASDTGPSVPDKMCDISCCLNITNSAVVSFVAQAATDMHLRPAAYSPVNEIASSVPANLHTPPPRAL